MISRKIIAIFAVFALLGTFTFAATSHIRTSNVALTTNHILPTDVGDGSNGDNGDGNGGGGGHATTS